MNRQRPPFLLLAEDSEQLREEMALYGVTLKAEVIYSIEPGAGIEDPLCGLVTDFERIRKEWKTMKPRLTTLDKPEPFSADEELVFGDWYWIEEFGSQRAGQFLAQAENDYSFGGLIEGERFTFRRSMVVGHIGKGPE